jgi:hypothetical protein
MNIIPSLTENASPDAYAEAMVRCQGYAPSCSDAQECLFEGWCFTRHGTGFKGARKSIQALVNETGDVTTRAWLRLALDALDHHQFMERGAIDALKVVAINKKVREQYGDTSIL